MSSADLLVLIVALPGAAFLGMSLLWLLGVPMRERFISRFTAIVYLLDCLMLSVIGFRYEDVAAPLGNWFHAGEYHFPLLLRLDWISMPFAGMTVLLTGLIGAFSARYLHREPGFLRFFLLLNLFGFGSLLLFTAGSLDLLAGGWELVGITSVFLIAFFQHRPDPVSCGGRVFAVYRATDIGLLAGVVAMHHLAGTTDFATAQLPAGSAAALGALLLLAAAGKSAMLPFSSWLPRAMEGPTPSSAIFYGAISVHAGAYLLLRVHPMIGSSTGVNAAMIALGLLSAVLATLVGRACTDAKTSLAYASITQLGVIFAEIGMGFTALAVWHCCGHAAVRTLQFLRAPSALHEFHQVHAAAGGHLDATGTQYEAFLPAGVRNWLYRLAIDRGHLDALLDRCFVIPMRALGELLNPSSRPGVAKPEGRKQPRLAAQMLSEKERA